MSTPRARVFRAGQDAYGRTWRVRNAHGTLRAFFFWETALRHANLSVLKEQRRLDAMVRKP